MDPEPNGATVTKPTTVDLGAAAGGELNVLRGQQLAELAEAMRAALQLRRVDDRWEYRFAAPRSATWIQEGLSRAEREFNDLGSHGWELVGFLEHGTAIFKRRVDTA